MRLKKTVALCLSMLTAFSFMACDAGAKAGSENENASVYSETAKVYEANTQNDGQKTTSSLDSTLATRKKYGSYWMPLTDYKTMPIGAYNGFPPSGKYGFSYDYEKLLSDYNELGVNFLFGLYNYATGNLEFEKTTLSLCEEYDIGYLSLWEWEAHLKSEEDLRSNQSVLNTLKSYSSFLGLSIVDEPGYKAFQDMTNARDTLKDMTGENSDEYLYHVNLLPNWTLGKHLYNYKAKNEENSSTVYENYTYEQYLSDYMRIYKPQVLSYDFYPIVGGQSALKDGYFENLSIIRETALEANIPFWTFVQTCAWDEGQRLPTQSELLWNVNTCLAYGAKGIEYFCGVEPSAGENEYFEGSLFYKDGSHVPVVYDSALLANEQIQAVDEVLMCARSKGVIFVGDMPALSDGTNGKMTPSAKDVLKGYNELTSVSAFHALIGCFNYDGKTAFYVVNNSVNDSDTVILQFNQTLNGTYTQGAVKKDFAGDSLCLSLPAGDGVLVVLD